MELGSGFFVAEAASGRTFDFDHDGPQASGAQVDARSRRMKSLG